MKDRSTTLTPELLLGAYASGIFPMAEGRDDPEIFWVEPRMRGILPLERFHISRSLRRRIRAGGFRVTLNTDFEGVVAACADRAETWISHDIADLYSALHERGFAHSLEIWHEGTLTGGVYGVSLGGAFFGESMFSKRTDASKLALAYLTNHLSNCGFSLFDTQFITPHLESLGAIEVPRARYQTLLSEALSETASIHAERLNETAHSVLQDRTQTS